MNSQKRRISRREFIGVAAGVIGTGVLGAALPSCQPKAPAEATKPPAGAATAAPKGQVKVGFMHFTAPLWEPGVKAFIATFEQKNPNIKIDWQPQPWNAYWEAVTTGLASGDIPDVLLLIHTNLDNYLQKGAIQPLDDYFTKDKWDLSVFYPTTNYQQTIQGKHYGVGWTLEAGVVFYNKDLFDQMKVPYPPKDGKWDWNDLLEAAKAMTKRDSSGKMIQCGLSASAGGSPQEDSMCDALHSNGGRIINDDGDYSQCLLGSDEARQAFKFMSDLYTVHKIIPTPDESAVFQNGFMGGNVAMFWTACGRWSNFLEAKFNVDLTSAPFSPNTNCRLVCDSPNSYTMTKAAKHPAEAWEFMKWLGNGDSDDSPQAIWAREAYNCVPHIKANEKYLMGKTPNVNRQAALDAYNYQYRYPHCPPFVDLVTAYNNELGKLTSGTPIGQCIDAAVARCNQILKDNQTSKGWGIAWKETPNCKS
jgi:ABC-type glycerol-3-phosphate transport system substrate-binding protein